MTKETLKALKASIAHWRRLATGKSRRNEGVGSRYCALCLLHLENDCVGCPIEKKTGMGLCQETPYEEAADLFHEDGKLSPAFQAAARKQLAFLESLLPKNAKG